MIDIADIDNGKHNIMLKLVYMVYTVFATEQLPTPPQWTRILNMQGVEMQPQIFKD